MTPQSDYIQSIGHLVKSAKNEKTMNHDLIPLITRTLDITDSPGGRFSRLRRIYFQKELNVYDNTLKSFLNINMANIVLPVDKKVACASMTL